MKQGVAVEPRQITDVGLGNILTFPGEVMHSALAPKVSTLIHVAQTHVSIVREQSWEEIIETAVSQFNVAKTIIANPDAMVFKESLTKNLTERDGLNPEVLGTILNAFPESFPNYYDDLTVKQIQCLVRYGASHILFGLGIIKCIYKTSSEDGGSHLMKELNKRNFFNPNQITKTSYLISNLFFNHPFIFNPELKKIINDEREELALKCVMEVAANSEKDNPLILLIFGSAHKFGEKIRELGPGTNIHYEGRVPTLSRHTVSSKNAEQILPCGVAILPAKQNITLDLFREIISYYRTKYKSTSIFKDGYRSAAMKALADFLCKMEKEQINTITYMDILEVLARTDENKAKLFREGVQEKVLHSATDKIIIELRMTFESNSQCNNSCLI